MRLAITAFLLSTALGQSVPADSLGKTFHVQGKVEGVGFSRTAGAEVVFQGESKTVTLHTDGQGFYQVDLPFGQYTMRAQYNGWTIYQRPIFRVSSPTTIVLNIAVHTRRTGCDLTVSIQNPTITEEQTVDGCGGSDRFAVLSKSGVPFELLIVFPGRERTGQGPVYYGLLHRIPVFAAYNLFTLEANRVAYHPDSQTLEASGNVVWTDDSGSENYAESASFKMEDGQATLIP